MTDPGLHSAADFHNAYEEYAKNLRTWFVAYGIGGPVLFVGNQTLWAAVTTAGHARLIAGAFLTGVVLQVGLAALNKTVMWLLYWGESNAGFKNRRAFKIADEVSTWFAVDLAVDLFSLALFILATYLTFKSFAPAS